MFYCTANRPHKNVVKRIEEKISTKLEKLCDSMNKYCCNIINQEAYSYKIKNEIIF